MKKQKVSKKKSSCLKWGGRIKPRKRMRTQLRGTDHRQRKDGGQRTRKFSIVFPSPYEFLKRKSSNYVLHLEGIE